MCGARRFIIEDVTHGGGEPVGTEDDDVAQGWVVFVMREMTEAVRDGNEEPRDFIIHVVGAADVEDFTQRQIRRALVLQGLTDIGKTFRHGATDFGQARGDLGNGAFEFINAFAVAVLVGFTFDEEKVNDGFFAEQIPQFLTVNIGLTLLRSAVRGDDENLRTWLAALDELNPFLDLSRLRTFARFPDNEINGGRAEE